MIPFLPPLQALRAFEAAARHLSYSRAADELSLTHGAISHNIARLEEDLGGVRLFMRSGQRMVLTEAGQLLLIDMREGLRMVGAAFEKARAKRPSMAARTLTVSVLPSFAVRWLVPRLSRFQALRPEVDIAIRPSTSLALMDGRDGVDLAIRYGGGNWADLRSARLLKSMIFPVCSPEFLAKSPIQSPDDLRYLTLLRNPRQKWRPWFIAAGLDLPEPLQGPLYDDAGLLLQAAAQGQGVALARSALAADDLASGRLLRVCNEAIEDDYSWFIAWREPLRCSLIDFKHFVDWLHLEAASGA